MKEVKDYIWFLNDLSNGDRHDRFGLYPVSKGQLQKGLHTYIWTFTTRAAARTHYQEHQRNPKFADLSAPKKMSLRAVRRYYDDPLPGSVAKNYLRINDRHRI